ncbi:MAG: lipoyl synthase, partial [Acidobacteriota bacterium]
KSGMMLGLGERREEVVDVMKRLLEHGCEMLTIGQYLQPNREKLDVVEYVRPEVFEEYGRIGEQLGFRAVFSGPFVRSSYMADLVASR